MYEVWRGKVNAADERHWLCNGLIRDWASWQRENDKAFGAWWGYLKGKGRGKVRAPRFKKRSNGQSMHFTRSIFRVEGYTLRLTKVGAIPTTWSRKLPVASGVQWRHRHHGKTVGVDPGLATLAVNSEGEEIAPPKFLRSPLQRIRRLSRDLSRKAKGSSNQQKARLRVAKAHAIGGGPTVGSSPQAQHQAYR